MTSSFQIYLNLQMHLHKKASSLKRWLAICSDDLVNDRSGPITVNILRKYLGDLLITSYINTVQDSGYTEEYVKEIESTVLVKSLDSFWSDHLVNMDRLKSAMNMRSFGHWDPLVEALLSPWSTPMESEEVRA